VLHTLYRLLVITFTPREKTSAALGRRRDGGGGCGRMIHSDFARRFIKAEVVPLPELVECGGLAPARDKGRVRLEGKEYRVHDGDVLYIRHTA
jgi:ribosome-binding ATPase YchF (GTP1/OBG family)